MNEPAPSLLRRDFLAAAAAGFATFPGVNLPSAEDSPDGGQDSRTAEPAITTATLAEAEKLCGMSFTQAERELMVRTIAEQVRAARLRPVGGAATLPAPASRFSVAAPPPAPEADAARRARDVELLKLDPPGGAADDSDLAFASVLDLARRLRAGSLTSARLTRLCLDRLEMHGGALKCVISLMPRRAEEAAARADAELRAGRDRGPLHGIPYGLKDLFDTDGTATTFGAEPYGDRIPEDDAEVVKKLEAAGAVPVAKLSLGALAMGDVWFGGRTNNPWNPDEGSSGSSAGSCAAVAAGLVPFAIGTETLGSIVSPSMRCGVVGLRPTFGAVARGGAMPLCWSLDKIGPITRTVEDARLVFEAIRHRAGDATADVSAAAMGQAADLRAVGFVQEWFGGRGRSADLDRAALDAVWRICDARGLRRTPITIPDLPYNALYPVLSAEAAAAFEELTISNRDDLLREQGPGAWPNQFRQARFISAVDCIQGDRLRRRIVEAFAPIFEKTPVIVAPSFGNPMLVATNFMGTPSLTLRAGFRVRERRGESAPTSSRPGVETPHGITLWGGPGCETLLCEVGAALEARLAVAARRPPLFT